MGGASRAEKRRKQEAANARLAAAGIRPTKNTSSGPSRNALIAVAVVVAVVVVVGVTVLLTRGSEEAVVPTYTATASGAVVTAGDGSVQIDVYEDYLCPECERFEDRDGNALTTALNAGQVTVRYHGVAILDGRTTPAGYSTRAANAALCSVEAGIFPTYHARLFESQPGEGGAGLTDDQLVAFGSELGAAGDFAGCVTGATHVDVIAAETDTAAANPALQGPQGFGTPTVTVGGVVIDLNDTSWLSNAIAG